VAYIGNYDVDKIDVKGAYIQTEITGLPIYMKMDKRLTTAVILILPELKPYVTPSGTLYTKLLKALYGCIQSGQLWYSKISKVLSREGYTRTPTDPCIFCRLINEKIFILILYVNDILLFADSVEIARVKTFMERGFKWITVIQEKTQSYLRMNVELQDHKIIVDMEYFTQQLLSLFTNIKQYPTPAVKECFKLRESPKLDVTGQKTFHTIVAKLLYLAKRARPDILTANQFFMYQS
jgi:hypothetical protein